MSERRLKMNSFPFYWNPGVLRDYTELECLLHVQEQKLAGVLGPLDKQRLQVGRFAALASAKQGPALRVTQLADLPEVRGQDLRYPRHLDLDEDIPHKDLLEEHSDRRRPELEVPLADLTRLLVVVQAREREDRLGGPLVFRVHCLCIFQSASCGRRKYIRGRAKLIISDFRIVSGRISVLRFRVL